MKTHVWYLTCLLVFCWLSPAVLADCPTPDAWEDNDTLGTATLVTMFPTEMNLNVAWDDMDYTHYYIEKDVIINVSIYFQNILGDIDIQLLNAGGTVLAQSTSVNDMESIMWQAPADMEVYLRVFLYSGDCNSYYLFVDYDFSQACLDDPYEDNDQPESASWLDVPSVTGGLVSKYGDQDFYIVTAAPGIKLDIQCLFSHSQGDIDLYFLDDYMNLLGSSTSVDNDEQIVWTSDRSGAVFGLVQMNTPGGCNIYTLSIDGCPAPEVYIDMASCEHYLGAYMLGGTVYHTALQSWTLDYTGGSEHGWVPIASGVTPVFNSVLGVWDATYLEPCAYTLRLRAVGSCPDGPVEAEYMVSLTVGIPGDMDRDGNVDMDDFSQFASMWLMVFP
jgi:hypothetical protein